MKLIVYGTLMRGESNHHMMAGAEYLGHVTVANAKLYDLGSFPGLCFNHAGDMNDDIVHGELYEVSEKHLAKLDRFEGVPHLYDRIECNCSDGLAYIYEYQDNPYDSDGDYNNHIKSGNWKDR